MKNISTIDSYEAARRYLESAAKAGSHYGLERERELLRRLGNPQDALRFIHVAGTNGKGSVCAYVTSILREAGYRIGRFLSPVLFGYREKIQVEDAWISKEAVTKQTQKIESAVSGMVRDGWEAPTVFEQETAMAFLEFLDKNCDLVVLETGLGGRLDSTNVIQTACVAVLTSISMDHTELLGDSLTKIAGEKCGIIKPGMQVVSAPQKPEAEAVIQEICAKNKLFLCSVKRESIKNTAYTLSGTKFDYTVSAAPFPALPLLETGMLGACQPENAAVALEAAVLLQRQGYQITVKNMMEGLKKARWPGRFSLLSRKPAVILDGAHNPDAARVLHASEQLYFSGRPIQRVIGVFSDKEYAKICAETIQKEDTVYTITAPGPRGLSSSALAACARRYSNHVEDVGELRQALRKITGDAVIYGSLSFLGEVYREYPILLNPYQRDARGNF